LRLSSGEPAASEGIPLVPAGSAQAESEPANKKELPMAAPVAFDIKDLEKRMRTAFDALKRELQGLRTGRASANLLDPVMVNVYGQRMPINQVGTVTTPEARMITVQVWDKATLPAVEKAIREANLGLNPQIDGMLIRLPIPSLTADRRAELVKLARKYSEEHGKVAMRTVRKDGMDHLKKLQKDGHISEDESRKNSDKVQELTDRMIKEIDTTLAAKEVEINKV
jgi:ribosome recycling factor